MADEELLEFEPELEFEDADAPPKSQPVRKEIVFALDPVEPTTPHVPPVPHEIVAETVREWHPHTSEDLPTIESTIDGWGGRSTLDAEELHRRVDRLTKRVKSREVVVQETVTEYVDEPVAAEEEATEIPPPKSKANKGKRSGKGFLGFFGPRKTKEAVDKATSPDHAKGGDDVHNPQCMALTADGAQCRNSARGDSKYCISHKGYQPPTAKGIAQRVEGEAWDPSDKVTDRSTVRAARTRPSVRKAEDTPLAVRKSGKSGKKKSGKKR